MKCFIKFIYMYLHKLSVVVSFFQATAIRGLFADRVSHSYGPTPEQRHDFCFALV